MKTGRISPETSCRIANLGFVCTLLVIVIHIRNVPQEVGSLPWLTHFVVRNVFASVAVPFFFIVSGCFLGRHVGEPSSVAAAFGFNFFTSPLGTGGLCDDLSGGQPRYA